MSVFNEYRRKYAGQFLVEDGIINADRFAASTSRMLMLMKETPIDNTAGPRFSISDAIERRFADGATNSIHDSFLSLTRWAYLIETVLSGRAPVAFQIISGARVKQPMFAEYFRSIAYANVRKANGAPKSDPRSLGKAVDADRELLVRQIDKEIAPRVVYCCGTYEQYKRIYRLESLDRFDGTLKESRVHLHDHNGQIRLVYRGWHPSGYKRITGKAIYEKLITDLTEPAVQAWSKADLR